MNTAGERPLILLIEDDQGMADALSMLLEDWGFAYIAADSPGAAVRSLGPRIKDVRALITDLQLRDGFTGLSGAAEIVKAIGHSVPIMITTGFTGLERYVDPLPVLSKPFDPSILHQWLDNNLAMQRQ
jgi:DNA-binding NtrC family response regulator